MESAVKQKFLVNSTMHMGPISRNLDAGDVVCWTPSLDEFTVNGVELPNDGRKDSKEGFERAAKALEKLAEMRPEEVTIVAMDVGEEGEAPKTDTLVVFPILGCLQAACDYLGYDAEWVPVNDEQTQFVELFLEHLKVIDDLDCLERKADRDASVINNWLKERGFNIELRPVADGFAVASILDVLVKWLKEGDKAFVENDNGRFEGVRLKKGVAAYMQKELYPYPVVKVRTQSDDIVCMAIADSLPKDRFAINWKVEQLRAIQKPYDAQGVVFPMVKYDKMVDISWIEGMCTKPGQNDDGFYISQAIQQTKFRMNEIGARAESAVAMTFRCMAAIAPDPWVILDKPFILWIERPGVEMPLFAGVFAEDVWENPGGLD